MKETINKLNQLLKFGTEYISTFSEAELTHKSNPKKWSKKEILGHLIDSGINNLQRFTEIQFQNKPYRIRKYNQDELVKANDYQNSETKEILEFWKSINNRILYVIKQQTEETLAFKIKLEKENFSDLRFLMNDYVDHMEHHLNQIKS
ncbi:DinB family protein [Tenacibaculum caenipelagi]|uniref:DinB family protein n=1 Tax=Tenacibaculum caenipelagi TaxID=1325435 RepID=A0A4R6TBZ0_9FLAO|nr:DinB family protein [Tenacibaculum caenipelagi]TDQ25661.1 DinB family protein [Tenacibaculum caenipelagi]